MQGIIVYSTLPIIIYLLVNKHTSIAREKLVVDLNDFIVFLFWLYFYPL
ncbi:MAG: hypothetical protein JWR61_2394 [Ferruginibacter sp.]|nr:hypothetical protein [Ferruginibacter sp.]